MGWVTLSGAPNWTRLFQSAGQSRCGIGVSPAISFLSMAMPLEHPIVRPNRGGRKPAPPDPGWRVRIQALRHVPRLVRLVWRTEPRYVAGIIGLRVARALVPLAVLWIGKLIVDEVVRAVGTAAGRARWIGPAWRSCS